MQWQAKRTTKERNAQRKGAHVPSQGFEGTCSHFAKHSAAQFDTFGSHLDPYVVVVSTCALQKHDTDVCAYIDAAPKLL